MLRRNKAYLCKQRRRAPLRHQEQPLQDKPDIAECLLKRDQADLNAVQNLLHLKFRRQHQIAIHGTVLALMAGVMMIMPMAILLRSLLLQLCGMPGSGIMCGMLRDRRMRSRCREQKRTRNGFTDRGNLILRRKQRL